MSVPRVAAFAWLAAGFLAGGSTAAAQSFTFERSFPATAMTRLDVRTDRGKITVRAGTAAELVVTTSSSRINATRLGAGLYVRTGSGQVTASFDDEGDADVETGSSAITVDGLHGGFAATTRSGRVRISGRPSRPWRVTTGSSAIEAEFVADAAFSIEAVSGSGSVRTDKLEVQGEASKGRVVGSIAGGGPAVELTSRSGSIRLTSAR